MLLMKGKSSLELKDKNNSFEFTLTEIFNIDKFGEPLPYQSLILNEFKSIIIDNIRTKVNDNIFVLKIYAYKDIYWLNFKPSNKKKQETCFAKDEFLEAFYNYFVK